MNALPAVGPLRLLLITLLSFVGFLVLTSFCVAALSVHYDLSLATADASFATIAERQHLRFVLLLNNLGTWGLSAIAALAVAYGNYWPRAAGLVAPRRPELIGTAVLAFVVGMPLIALAAYLNLQLDLPDWMLRSEDAGNAMLAGVLTFERVPELLLALLTVALVPAFAEEIMFRGLLQGRLLPHVMSGHVAVWVGAFIFSGIHVEFAGFLPRLLLGALLGYAYRWTGTLWIPIALHFLFNGSQVVATYLSGEFTPDTEMDSDLLPLLIAGGLSLAGTAYLGWKAERQLGAGAAAD
ncbi:CPBP family intramembrane glutamic endopeptidase [Lewinella sp. IMCC34183]|uniref:CPBP family intramembrane glutamic endopeptidase n=1 Tax=Lewinella sp. IMCC34183 TaxID=2248762 RepID=UPI000E2664E6|nr:type II CAAX endopeptidase family protein [Lewinella sp. IMCC34183]